MACFDEIGVEALVVADTPAWVCASGVPVCAGARCAGGGVWAVGVLDDVNDIALRLEWWQWVPDFEWAACPEEGVRRVVGEM